MAPKDDIRRPCEHLHWREVVGRTDVNGIEPVADFSKLDKHRSETAGDVISGAFVRPTVLDKCKIS